MYELSDLYQDVVIEHSKTPHNFRAQACPPASSVEGYNPLCGDKVRVYVDVENGAIADVSFEGSGCAISTAAASLMTDALKGKSPAEALDLFERYHDVLCKNREAKDADLGMLEALAGVRDYPMRVKCATLAWHALKSALEGDAEKISTEQGDAS